jgi:hypothetical protein
MARRFAFVLSAALAGCAAAPEPQTPRLGRPVSADEAPRPDPPTVFPDGGGLPPGRGTAADGQALYAARCAACHGARGEGGSGGRLVGRAPLLASPWPEKTVGQYWPYATTLYDYIRRAMPIDAPGSLSADQGYALTAWVLHANGIIGPDDEMNALALPRVRMPNRDGFVRP